MNPFESPQPKGLVSNSGPSSHYCDTLVLLSDLGGQTFLSLIRKCVETSLRLTTFPLNPQATSPIHSQHPMMTQNTRVRGKMPVSSPYRVVLHFLHHIHPTSGDAVFVIPPLRVKASAGRQLVYPRPLTT